MIAAATMTTFLLLLLSIAVPIKAFAPPSSVVSTGAAARLTNYDTATRKNLPSLHALKEATFGMGCVELSSVII